MSTATLTLKRFTARRDSDERLMAAALQRDPVAFSELYRRHKDRIYGYCLARLMSREAAADATQEVFLRLLRSESETVDEPVAWLFTVARNVVVDMLRKNGRLREDADLDEDSPAWSRLAAADSAEEMLTREGARNVFLALRRVSPRYRTALILREIHAQTSRDIARALGTTVGAVDTLVSRARDAFGKAYAEVCGLSEECRAAVTLIYKRQGTGLDDAQSERLKAHLDTCGRCRSEAKRAGDPRRMPGLLPFLVPAGAGPIENILARASMLGDMRSALERAWDALSAGATPVSAKIAAGVLAASLVATPIAGKSALDASARASARDIHLIVTSARRLATPVRQVRTRDPRETRSGATAARRAGTSSRHQVDDWSLMRSMSMSTQRMEPMVGDHWGATDGSHSGASAGWSDHMASSGHGTGSSGGSGSSRTWSSGGQTGGGGSGHDSGGSWSMGGHR